MYFFEQMQKFEYIKNANNSTSILVLRDNCLNLLFDNQFKSTNAKIKIETLINAINEDSLFINHNFTKLKEILNNFYLLLNSKNFETIKNTFYYLYDIKDLTQYILNAYDIYEEKLKYDYANKFAKRYTPDGTFVDKKGINYKNVVDITNEDFFLNVHNINIGLSNYISSIEITKNPYLFTDKNYGASQTISGTTLSPDFISYVIAEHKKEVLYGFNHIQKDDIIVIGNDDLNTKSNNLNRKDIEWNKTILYSPNTLFDHIKWKYAESVIWRSSQGEKRKPDYILCMDDINKNSIKHAHYFDIPIYFIDSIKALKNKLTNLQKDFENLKTNPNLTLIEYRAFLNKIKSYYNQLQGLLFLHYSNKEFIEIRKEFDKFSDVIRDYLKDILLNYECKNDEIEEILKQSIISEQYSHLFR